jgi:D-amino-acid dehydrogenase
MRVVVVGAGVIGVTSAYYLSKAGFEVTVVDRADEVASGASHANGGQLSYSFTDALAKPGFIAKIPGLIAGRDAGSKMRLAPNLLPWAARFLLQCTSQRARENTLAVLHTAMRSEALLDELCEQVAFDFSYRAAGKLVLLADADEMRSATASSALKKRHGNETEVLSLADSIAIEPALANFTGAFAGAVYSKNDEVADARLFTLRLKEWLEEKAGVRFRLGQSVKNINSSGNRVRSVQTQDEELAADAVVVCAGAWSRQLLRPLGINPHIYPVRGYSVTLPVTADSPTVSVTALKQRIVFGRINGSMRIAGFADFNGLSTEDDATRIATMIDVARRCAPLAADYDTADRHDWGGFRPMTPDGRPRIGATPVRGLYLNLGQGMLGWTLACASGHDVTESISTTLN